MKYDFDRIIDRKDTNSLKWDLFDTQLPMWVADMDFEVAPEIKKALNKRVEHGVFGYAIIPDEYYESYIKWWKSRHNLEMKKDNLLFSIGVMPSISTIIRELTNPEDSILIQTPVYHVFFYVIQDNNRKVLENKLEYDGTGYSINFEDLEEKLSREETKMMILCNPHNPVGKIWNEEELQKIDSLCKKYNVILISDEIHCDLVNPDKKYIAFENVTSDKENVITCLAPTKTFNIAGIQSSVIHVSNIEFYDRIKRRLKVEDSSQINVFSIEATIAAFNECEEWVTQLNQYIYNNKKIVEEYIQNNIPELKLVSSEATYLLWIDCTELNMKSQDFKKYLNENYGLLVSPGAQFGEVGDNFLRLNIACPQEILLDGLNRLKTAIENI